MCEMYLLTPCYLTMYAFLVCRVLYHCTMTSKHSSCAITTAVFVTAGTGPSAASQVQSLMLLCAHHRITTTPSSKDNHTLCSAMMMMLHKNITPCKVICTLSAMSGSILLRAYQIHIVHTLKRMALLANSDSIQY